jgi:hypothetical protein
MEKKGITLIIILIIAAISFSGCTSSSPAQSSASSATDPAFNHLLLFPEDLPPGLSKATDGPMPVSDITDTMRTYGFLKGYRALYADTIPLTGKSKIMEQDIMVFSGVNASSMLDDHEKSLTEIQSQAVVTLPLPDPNLGERSFALKISTVDPAGAETHHYVFGFVQSGMYEVISMEGTPETYQTLLQVAERAAEKAR